MPVALAAALLLLGGMQAATAQVDSAYSTLDWERGCTLKDRAGDDQGGAWSRLVCEGHAGYPVFVADDDQRMSLDYGFTGGHGPWESFSGFNRVHETIEWRRETSAAGRRPFATIHRWFVSGRGGEERQVLVISTVAPRGGGRSCMVGFVDAGANANANRLARNAADNHARGFRCGVDQPRYHGATNARSPQPARTTR
jgi:hypothetical protein